MVLSLITISVNYQTKSDLLSLLYKKTCSFAVGRIIHITKTKQKVKKLQISLVIEFTS